MATYELAGVELDSPLVNAAGSINGTNVETILREVELLADTGIGAITGGSFTVPAQEGNAAKFGEPVYYHDPVNGKTYNSMGLPNIGKDAAVELAPQVISRANGKPVIYSGSPTNAPEHGSSVEQATRLAYDFLETGVDLVEINVSCPNVVTEGGGRKPIMGYDLETMQELISSLTEQVGEGQKLGVKLPPYLSDDERLVATDLAKILRASNVFRFIVTANTIPNQEPLNEQGEHILTVPGGKGGMSGSATKQTGREQLELWREQMGDSVDIVSTLGVDSGKELKTRLQLGAVAAGGVTFLWESSNWKNAVTKVLFDFAA
jgi:dihydroorotate dehydrogenase